MDPLFVGGRSTSIDLWTYRYVIGQHCLTDDFIPSHFTHLGGAERLHW